MFISSMVLVSEGAATSQRYVAVSILVVFLITRDVLLRISARVAKSPDTEEKSMTIKANGSRLVLGA